MERKIGLVLGFIGIAVMAACMILAAYKTAPLAAVALGGLYLSMIRIFLLQSKNNREQTFFEEEVRGWKKKEHF